MKTLIYEKHWNPLHTLDHWIYRRLPIGKLLMVAALLARCFGIAFDPAV